MVVVSERPERAAAPKSGMRAYARLGDTSRDRTMVPPARPAEDSVTLEKIGEFLELDLRRITAWLRSGLLLIAVLAVAGALSGALYSSMSKPRFTVTTDVLIDPADLQLFDADLFAARGQLDNALLIAGSKVRVLTSRNVLERVVVDLDLANDPEFYDPNAFDLKSLFGAAKVSANPQAAALQGLSERVSTRLDEKSFVTSLAVSAETTDKAIAISGAMIQAFKAELAAAEADSATRAASALEDRLAELRSDVQLAEQRVEAFRRDNNLASSNGQLVTSQSLTQLNAEFVAAQSRALAAEADYRALLTGDANARPDISISATLTALRDKASSVQQEASAQAMIYGPLHPRMVSLNAELAVVNGQIQRELARTIAVAKSEADQSAAVVAALTTKMSSLSTDAFSDGDLQVKLRELERDAVAKTSVYENFLERSRQVSELEQISTTNVRTISTAVPPSGRAWPPGIMVMGIVGAIGGTALGIMLAIATGLRRDLRGAPRRLAASHSRA